MLGLHLLEGLEQLSGPTTVVIRPRCVQVLSVPSLVLVAAEAASQNALRPVPYDELSSAISMSHCRHLPRTWEGRPATLS